MCSLDKSVNFRADRKMRVAQKHRTFFPQENATYPPPVGLTPDSLPPPPASVRTGGCMLTS